MFAQMFFNRSDKTSQQARTEWNAIGHVIIHALTCRSATALQDGSTRGSSSSSGATSAVPLLVDRATRSADNRSMLSRRFSKCSPISTVARSHLATVDWSNSTMTDLRPRHCGHLQGAIPTIMIDVARVLCYVLHVVFGLFVDLHIKHSDSAFPLIRRNLKQVNLSACGDCTLEHLSQGFDGTADVLCLAL